MILISKIAKKYKNETKKTLKNITTKFPDTGLIFITGESGSGKSTFLNMIGLLDKPDEGKILVDGKNICEFKKYEIDNYHKEIVSFIYQNYNLINHGTVLENITLFNKNEDYKDALELVGLSKLKNKKVSKLSGGEMQRVAIARALVKKSKIVLCDEPTGALDDENGHNIMKILKDISKSKLVIVVTHNVAYAKKYGDRILHMIDGEIVSDNKDEPKNKIKEVLKLRKKNYSNKIINNMVMSSFKSKMKRNLLTAIAIFIGLSSLLLVLSVKKGFNNSLKDLENETLATYPIYISESSVNLEDEVKNIFTSDDENNKDFISVQDIDHKNKIDNNLLKHLETLKDDIKYIQYNYVIDSSYVTAINKKNMNDFLKNVHILSGVTPSNYNEVLLIVNSKKQCDKYLLQSIGLKDNIYEYDDIVGYTYKLNNKVYKITGVAIGWEDSFYYDYVGMLYIDNFKNIIPESFYIFPNCRQCKDHIKFSLKEYDSNLYYTDYANTISNVSKTFVDAVSLVLILFSFISLFVSIIMIYVVTHISVTERIREIGILRSMGMSQKNIKSIFVRESFVISILATCLSVIFVFVVSSILNKVILNAVSLSDCIKIDTANIFLIFLVSIIVGYLGSNLPAKSASKLKISEMLRYE